MIIVTDKRVFKIKGVKSFIPNMIYANAIKNVHSGEEVADVNPYLCTPHTPYFAKFFAIAICIYTSSSA